jgi:maltooligosyltrehalose trehalohydrolase
LPPDEEGIGSDSCESTLDLHVSTFALQGSAADLGFALPKTDRHTLCISPPGVEGGRTLAAHLELDVDPRPARAAARRLPIGAEPRPGGGVDFRVWAPARQRVEVVFEAVETVPKAAKTAAPKTAKTAVPKAAKTAVPVPLAPVALEREPGGYFSGVVEAAAPGALYRFRLDGEGPFPDPASRFQPAGPHGPSQVVDPTAFPWTDAGWRGIEPWGQVIYELHVGTFTRAGTFRAAAAELPELAALGVTVIELLPVADFAGRFGWGYDGVDLFAPTRLYGEPDDLRTFVDRAHAIGLGVILDVVYNHLGPDGNYLTQFAPAYFSNCHGTDWGVAINFDGPQAAPVREFYLANVRHWIEEYHLDGLRLDATQDIHDDSPDPILAALARVARQAAGERSIFLVAENEPQETRLARPAAEGGCGLDALWNDDFHHSAVVALTGRREAYYTDYLGTSQELVSAVKHGYLYQGQRYSWQEKRRGTSSRGLPPWAFVSFLENHDQVANTLTGERLHTRASPGCHRALTALLLLGPATPMLFQGQEFGASAPFPYFADHGPALAQKVRQGRQEFLAQFPSLAGSAAQAAIPDPGAQATFERAKLDFGERQSHAASHALHRDLLHLRRREAVLAGKDAARVDGAVLGEAAFVLRFFAPEEEEDRLLIVNLGREIRLISAPEPLLAPPAGCRWALLWSSEDPRYGGSGTVEPESAEEGWRISGQAAVFLGPASEVEHG